MNRVYLVTNDWEFELAAGYLINVFHPAAMAFHCVSGQPDQLDPTTGEFRLEFSKGPEFSRASVGFGQLIDCLAKTG